uniref:Ionotropic glutamate receptor C-terminal domain-containing protein n=1 Tax=Anopheles culicifacies TaxID=139723 RepID=A0A182MC87_9DIPT
MSNASSHRSSFVTSLQSAAISLATSILLSSPFMSIFAISMNPSSWNAFPFETPNCSCMQPAKHFCVRVSGILSLTNPSTSSSVAPSLVLHSAAKPRSISFACSTSASPSACTDERNAKQETGNTFILAQSTAITFLDQFHYVHDRAIARYSQKRIIIIHDEASENGRAILRHSAVCDVMDLLLVRPQPAHNRVDLLTSDVESEEWMLLDSYSASAPASLRIDLFPNRRTNLRGRYVRLAIFNYEPYTLWSGAENSDDANAFHQHNRSLTIEGTESRLFVEFCAKLNCSLEISLDEAGEWGQIYDNRTGDGIIGALVERRADVGVGALYSWYHESLYLALSKPISRTGVTCIVPKPLPLSSWMIGILPFSTVLWLAVLATIFVSTIFEVMFSFVTQKFRSIEAVLLRTNRNPYSSQMLLIGSLLFVGLMIGNAYSGGLASVMTVPRYEKSIDTVQDLADRNLRWGSTHDAWIFSIQLATQPTIVKLLDNFVTYPKDVLHVQAKHRNLAYSIERLPYGHYAVGDYITDDVSHNYEIMLEDIYWENCVAMATKTWPLMNELDELTLVIFQSGIQRYWELEVVTKFADNKVQHAISTSRHFENPGPIALQPSHLLGAFFLLAIGLGLGLVCLLLELLWHRLSTTQRTMKRRHGVDHDEE